jgi:5-methylthioribose kinase
MEFIAPPNIILRDALIKGMQISTFAVHLGLYIANVFFKTSSLYQSDMDARIADWKGNMEMCKTTAQVIFDEPYVACTNNRWTTPQLDRYVAGIYADIDLLRAVERLKQKFFGCPQALVHGDLHTGSVLVSEGVTKVIDFEFAYYGPMGHDLGALMGNLLLSYFSQDANNGPIYAKWVLEQCVLFYQTFVSEFLRLWQDHNSSTASTAGAGKTPTEVPSTYQQYVSGVYRDCLGFAGVVMIRRIVGVAHVADLETIADPDSRSRCGKRCLLFARRLIMESNHCEDISDTISHLQELLGIAATLYVSVAPDDWI